MEFEEVINVIKKTGTPKEAAKRGRASCCAPDPKLQRKKVEKSGSASRERTPEEARVVLTGSVPSVRYSAAKPDPGIGSQPRGMPE
jgi:hypothetical protein